ncbi:hypothetical protein K458DRAFT_418499 [Lentithecium fluviatile CBS 122367]|uniref:F-box domain-containing protein n=1 Tax=Lentithecium fluviatile CBS 122367 TaxID=1168545 RepID=A0A6G1J111_9PLEO|nr:hypothetical protein K458DRAFT_418499 [Lentithecium fluviatile CBS 122367]
MAHPPPPHTPSLPPELWIRILTYNTDLTHLWTTCRHISRTFRAYTEQVFAESVIRATYIDFALEKYNLGGKSKRPEIPTSFERFEAGVKLEGGGRDRTTVWFRDKRKKGDVAGGKKKEYDRIVRRWEDNVRGMEAQMPNYTVRIGNLVNDTALPGLEISTATRAIAFDWRRMYTLFFREQLLLRNLKTAWQRTTLVQIAANNARLAKGEKLASSDYPPAWPVAEIECRKLVRRKRLADHYADNEEMVWAIASLKCFENHGAAGGSARAFKLNPELPGAGLGERWFGSVSLVQGLYLDEWSCMHRIDTKVEHVRGEEEFPRYSVPPPDLKEEAE